MRSIKLNSKKSMRKKYRYRKSIIGEIDLLNDNEKGDQNEY